MLTALMTVLFAAMLLFTDHNDTWWNADLCWTSLGVWTRSGLCSSRGKAGALGPDQVLWRVVCVGVRIDVDLACDAKRVALGNGLGERRLGVGFRVGLLANLGSGHQRMLDP